MFLEAMPELPPRDSLLPKHTQHIQTTQKQCANILTDPQTYVLSADDLLEKPETTPPSIFTLYPGDKETICLAQYTCCLWLDSSGALLLQLKGVPWSFTLSSVSTDWKAINFLVRWIFGGNKELQQFTNGGYPMNDFLFSSIRIDLQRQRAWVEFTDQGFPPFEVPLYILEQLVWAIKTPSKQTYIDLNHPQMEWLIDWFADADLPEEYEDYQSLATKVDYVKIALRQIAP